MCRGTAMPCPYRLCAKDIPILPIPEIFRIEIQGDEIR
jgi:hypothetical protein